MAEDSDQNSIKEQMDKRFDKLMAAINSVAKQPTNQPVGVDLLCGLIAYYDSPLHKMSLEILDGKERVAYIDWKAVDKNEKVKFRVGSQIVDKFVEVSKQWLSSGLGIQHQFWHFDLFIIHELFHAFQGMERGKHSGLMRQSPHILAKIDYESDAFAVASLFALALLSPEHFSLRYEFVDELKNQDRNKNKSGQEFFDSIVLYFVDKTLDEVPYWGTLAKIIQAQIWHMSIFTAQMVDTKKNELKPYETLRVAAQRPFPVTKIERTFAWLLHYYRARYFKLDSLENPFRLLNEPLVEFRNLLPASSIDWRLVRQKWPNTEKQLLEIALTVSRPDGSTRKELGMSHLLNIDEPKVIICATGPYGLKRFVRVDTEITDQEYEGLFVSLFTGNLRKCWPFFQKLFIKAPWLIGYMDDPIRKVQSKDFDATIFTNKPKINNEYILFKDEDLIKKALLALTSRH